MPRTDDAQALEADRLNLGFWFPRPERGARLAEELMRRGHGVTIYHSLPIPGHQEHVRHVEYDRRSGLRVLRKLDHDVLYTSSSFLPVMQLRLNKWLTGRPYVYTLNGAIWAYYAERQPPIPLRGVKAAYYSTMLRLAVSGADAVVTNSAFLADELKARFPQYRDKMCNIYNGIDYDGIEAGRRVPKEWPPGHRRVLSVVTLQFEGKSMGVRLLLDAFERIGRRVSDATYLIAAKSENPAAVDDLRRYLRQHPLADRIRLHVNRRDVPDLLATADLFLYASPPDSSDSLPRALLEAQAAGVPTVTTDTTGCGEAVLHQRTGLVVEYDADAVAAAGVELLEARENALRMAEAGKKAVRDRFCWAAMADAYEEIFVRAAAGAGARAVRAHR
jgi:glycosyltransferase involved in cell wall biosynthesis